ncbi:MAG: carbamoyltransferase HypF [Jatrophihabitans sp.]
MSASVRAPTPVDTDRRRRRVRVRGVVQGVGFRPFVYVTATECALSGSVGNDSDGVILEVEGHTADLDRFVLRLQTAPPPLAVVESVEIDELPPMGGTGFRIEDSQSVQGGRTLASPDMATCSDCLHELADPRDRRFRHPFITCTNCGPRFTIITGLPYDRATTTMAGFAMCADCRSEYDDPTDRRFHAQPIACHDCGPTVRFTARGGGPRTGDAAIGAARDALAAGAIVAIKGLGGYHLACDAKNELAVTTLRARKGRGDKPFAVMVRDLDTARSCARIDDVEEALLTSPARPIVLLPRACDARVAPSIAPGSPDVGLFLPYTPLHVLLFGLDDDPPGPAALVMTSGNLSGEPIVTDDADATHRLAGLADAWLAHDRPIHVPCDDSVSRIVDGVELPLRRSRGHAPLPIALPVEVPPALAVGADLKNTCGVGDGRYGWLSQHIGDMDDVRTLDAFAATQSHLATLTGVAPTHLVADRHPGYRSVQWAGAHAAGRPVRAVQHHHAHIASVMAENGHDGSTPVIGIAFDGTGYGTDGAIWGGEALVADYRGFERFAHLGYLPLPGGDAAVQRPYRMALAALQAAGVHWDERLPSVAICPPDERRVLRHQLRTGMGCVPTSSMGRLFDAMSSLAGVRHIADYEAQAAIEFEALARGVVPAPTYSFPLVVDAATVIADPLPVVREIAADVLVGRAAAEIAADFHAAVIDLVLQLARAARDSLGLHTVGLSGGVFQNVVLLAGSCRVLRDDGFTLLRHQRVPPNDGGIALGQLLVGSMM